MPDLTRESLDAGGPGVRVVALADAGGAGALREALAGADPERVEVGAVVPRGAPAAGDTAGQCDLGERERTLLTAAVEASEAEGKTVRLLVVEARDAADAGARVEAALVAPR